VKLHHVAILVVSSGLLALGAVAVRADAEATCPVSGHKMKVTDKTVTLTVNGQKQYFCCANCPTAFVKEPAKFIKTEMTCPVMKGNKVNLATGPRVAINDQLLVTCCGGCPNAIVANPSKYVTELRDPVNGKTFKLTENAPHSMYKGVHYFFASEDDKKTFDADQEKYSNKMLSKAS
jgi:YHS domain-containing protein